jgi:acetyl esterase
VTLDHQTRDLIDQFASSGYPGFAAMTVAEARRTLVELRALAGPPEPIATSEADVAVRGGVVPLRVYAPVGDAPLPAVVYFHGGGFVCGGLDTIDAPLRALANRAGCAVVSVGYRLAPEHRFPTAHQDAYAATAWVAANAAGLAIDPDRLAVAGDSCGGNLATSVALMARERGPDLAFQALVYPMLDPACDSASQREFGEGFLVTRADLRWFWRHYLSSSEDAADPLASPLLTGVLEGLPRALVVTAEYDPLRDEGEAYADRLRGAGVAVTAKRYDGLIHACFQMGGVIDRSRAVIDDVARVLRTALAAESAPRTASRASPAAAGDRGLELR